MGEGNYPRLTMLAGMLLCLVLSGCQLTAGSQAETGTGVRITLGETYAGVRDGNVESAPLPTGSAYVTVEACVENLSAMERSIGWGDVYLATVENVQVYPVALGYDQAEAFSWLLPIVEPIGGKHIDHKFYFFRIQNQELMRIPARQSVGCRGSSQFTSMALLFILPQELAGGAYTLHFFEGALPVQATEGSPVPVSMIWGAALALALLSIVVVLLVIRKNRSRAEAAAVDTGSQDVPDE